MIHNFIENRKKFFRNRKKRNNEFFNYVKRKSFFSSGFIYSRNKDFSFEEEENQNREEGQRSRRKKQKKTVYVGKLLPNNFLASVASQEISIFDTTQYYQESIKTEKKYANLIEKPIFTLPRSQNSLVSCLKYSKDGNWLLSASLDKTIVLWDIACLKEYRRSKVLHNQNTIMNSMEKEEEEAFFPKSKFAINENKLFLKKLDYHGDWVRTMDLGKSKTKIISGCISGNIALYDITKEKSIFNFENKIINPIMNDMGLSLNAVNSLEFQQDTNEKLILSSFRDGSIRYFDTRISNFKKPVLKFIGHIKNTHFKIYPNNPNWLITGGRDSTIKIWDQRMISKTETDVEVQKANYIARYDRHTSDYYNVPFQINNNFIISGSEDGNVFFYDMINPNYFEKKKVHESVIHFLDCLNSQIVTSSICSNCIFLYESKLKPKNIQFSNICKIEPDYEFVKETEATTRIMEEIGDQILYKFHQTNSDYNDQLYEASMIQCMMSSKGIVQTLMKVQLDMQVKELKQLIARRKKFEKFLRQRDMFFEDILIEEGSDEKFNSDEID